jgi:acyl-CoA synthetase (AMP-forming)/AMP-acid ligase II
MHFEHGLFGLLSRTALASPDAPAVALGTQVVATYGQLSERSSRVGAGLRQLGCGRGDRVALFLKNHPAYLELMFACWHAGLVVVPINAKLHARELAVILEDSGAKAMFFDEGQAEVQQALEMVPSTIAIAMGSAEHRRLASTDAATPQTVNLEDLAWLFYTSGTTGRPKGAMLSHANLLAMSTVYACDVEPEGVGKALLHAAPMSHGSGLYALPHVLHGSLHICPESRGFDVDEVELLMNHHGQVSMFAAPTMVTRMTQAVRGDLPGLHSLIYGGGPMYVEDCVKAMDRFGQRLAQMYGQGETPMTITMLPKRLHDRSHPDFMARIASVGLPQTGIRVRVVDDQGRPLPAGEAGEIIVKGATVMGGYWKMPEATAKTLQDGWLYTGDVGSFDAQGFLTLKDRSKDVIISGGTNIYPREVEEVLLKHPGVQEVSVLGTPDPEWGESVLAVYTCRPGAEVSTHELDQLCMEHIARFKRPKHYVRMDELPKNAAGKILRNDLRKQLLPS